MDDKYIINIVFYEEENDEGKKERKAYVFYEDGTIEKGVSLEEAKAMCYAYFDENGFLDKGPGKFKELMNKEFVFTSTKEDLDNNLSKYMPENFKLKEVDSAIESAFAELDISSESEAEKETEYTVTGFYEEENVLSNTSTAEEDDEEFFALPTIPYESETEENSVQETINNSNSETTSEEIEEVAEEPMEELSQTEESEIKNSSIIDKELTPTSDVETEQVPKEEISFEGLVDSNSSLSEAEATIIDRAKERILKFAKENKLTSFIITGAILATGAAGYVAHKNPNFGKVLADATGIFAEAHADSLEEEGKGKAKVSSKDIIDDNKIYNDYTYYELINATKNQFQKRAMESVGTALIKFNGVFADGYVEEGKDIRAALTFDEVVALHQAYNDFSKEELQIYFNGAEIKANDMSDDYKNATLQLIGAYVIENRNNSIDMSELIESKEGKEFYQKYHEMLFQAKEATGKDKLAKVKAFYDAVRADFPIGNKERTEGISHADVRDSIEPYKLSVTPMIGAAEMMFQNLEVDYTLTDEEIEFFNDLGLCNYADATFRRVETATYSSNEDKTIPTFKQYRKSLIKWLTEKGQYVINDIRRDLSQLTAFLERVNGKYIEYGYFSYRGSGETQTSSYQQIESWQETEYSESETRVEKPMPEKIKEAIKAAIEKENQQAKEEAEAAAEDTRAAMQAEEDAKAAQIYAEVKERAKDLINKISDANKKIENGEQVSENDFGDHNVKFDSEHSDGNGNLDKSVEGITTDPTGDQTGKPLPDPNETGAKFDANVPTSTPTPSNEDTPETSNDEGNESASEEPEQETGKSWATFIDGVYDSQELHQNDNATQQPAEEGYDPSKEASREYYEHWYDQDSGSSYTIEEGTNSNDSSISNVQIVDTYVDSLDGIELEDDYQYVL